MSRFTVFGTAIAVGIGGCIAAAQTTVTNIFGDLNKVIPGGEATGLSDTVIPGLSGLGRAHITNPSMTLTIANGDNGGSYAYLAQDSDSSGLLNRVGRAASDPVGYSDVRMNLTLTPNGNDLHAYQLSSPNSESDHLTGSWAPDGQYVDPESAVDTAPPLSLLGSFNDTDPNGAWTLFLADLDFGEKGTVAQWGLIVTAIPEPSTWTLLVLGGVALGARLRQRRSAG